MFVTFATVKVGRIFVRIENEDKIVFCLIKYDVDELVEFVDLFKELGK